MDGKVATDSVDGRAAYFSLILPPEKFIGDTLPYANMDLRGIRVN